MLRVDHREIPATLAHALRHVSERGERVVVRSEGTDLGAVVSMEDLDLLRALEDHEDLEAAKEALAESDERIPYEKLRRELGLDRADHDVPD